MIGDKGGVWAVEENGWDKDSIIKNAATVTDNDEEDVVFVAEFLRLEGTMLKLLGFIGLS